MSFDRKGKRLTYEDFRTNRKQEMETEGYWPITRSSVKQEMEMLLTNIGSSREQLAKLNRQLQWMEIRLGELINGMESGT